jgi:hypothetical protein
MGFNKRYLTLENVTRVYERDGIKGLTNYITKSDALFTQSEKLTIICDIVHNDWCDTKKDVKIKKLIYKDGI